jgi:REP element-mobilizing transposase RayT
MTREQRDAANNARLMAELDGVPAERRSARFVCTMVLAGPRSDRGAGGFQPPDRAQPDTARFDGSFTKRPGDRLPHWAIADGTYFITFCAAKGVIFTEPERQIILNASLHHHESMYWLHTACVMPDHVHLLLRTIQRADGSWPTGAEVVHSIKSFTASRINRARGRTGPLWQRDYFDRLVRSAPEMDEANRYIQRNAQRAGLCDKAMEYPFVWRQERKVKGPGAGGFQPPDRAQPDAGEPSSALRADGGLEAPRSGDLQVLAVTTGAFEGRIGLPGEVPRGTGGFGYDPLFLAGPDHLRTGAELDKAEKNRLSHRGAAVRAMTEHIRRLLPNP